MHLNESYLNFVLVLLLLLSHSVMSDSAIIWTVVHQAPLTVGFFKQEYWCGLPFLLQGVLSTQGLNLC